MCINVYVCDNKNILITAVVKEIVVVKVFIIVIIQHRIAQ